MQAVRRSSNAGFACIVIFLTAEGVYTPTTLLQRFLDHFRSNDTEVDADSRFVPSQLDWSVRYEEDGGREEATREIERIQYQANEIEQRRREYSGRPLASKREH